jgi:hypothetical protein
MIYVRKPDGSIVNTDVIEDGDVLVTPLNFMDGKPSDDMQHALDVTRAVMDRDTVVQTNDNFTNLALRRPVRLADDDKTYADACKERDKAYAEMVNGLNDAWQKPAQKTEGDKAKQPPRSHADAAATRDAAYAQMVDDLRNAWRR